MITRVQIEEASDFLTQVAIENVVAITRTTARYLENPHYFTDLNSKLTALNYSVKAQQVNAALDQIEILGVGEVAINQSQTVGTDGLVYSNTEERQALVNYILGIVYEGFAPTILVDPDADATASVVRGAYSSGRPTLIFEGNL